MEMEVKDDWKGVQEVDNKMKTKEFKKSSLKGLLTVLVICCWFVPITIVLLAMSYYSNMQINDGLVYELSSSTENAIELSQKNIEYLISESKQVSYDEVIEDAHDDYVKEKDSVALYSSTTQYLQNSFRYNDYIVSSMVIYNELPETVYYANYYRDSQGKKNVYAFWEGYSDEVLEICESLDTGIAFLQRDGQLYMIRNIVDSKFEPYAVIILQLNIAEVFQGIEGLGLVEAAEVVVDGQTVIIVKADEEIVEGIEESTLGEAIEDNPNGIVESILLEDESESNIGKLKQDVYTFSQTVTYESWHENEYHIMMDTSVMTTTDLELRMIVFLLILMLMPLMAVVVFNFYKHFTKPIAILQNAARGIQKGDVGSQITQEAETREFEYIFNQFNEMSTSLQWQVEQIYEEQEALQNAKIKALQSQINPHFLNNTLEVINWEVRLGETENASQMIEALATMLNATMSRNESSTTHLKEEMMYVDAYLMIISTRMGKRLTIIREIDESAMDCEVPLLILQPIVENAVEHGISNRISGELIIRVYQTEEEVIVEVENDSPLSQDDKDRIEALLKWEGKGEKGHIGYSSLGIRNVNQRLKLIFGEKHCLKIESTVDNRTLSQIKFPIHQKFKN